PEHVAGIIELSLKNSDALKFKLAQVAATFGALKSWQGSGNFGRGRLLSALEDTPVYDEAIREIFHDDLAIESAGEVLSGIEGEGIAIETHGGHTPVGIGGRSSGRELLATENADASVIETVKNRIQEDEMRLFCLHCQEWERTQEVRRIPDQPECPLCGSTQIAALNPWAEEVVAAVEADEKDDEQEKQTKREYQAANLVQAH